MATYSFHGMDLRVVEIDGEPWFVVRDVCLALGMYLSPRDSLPIVTVAVRKLGEDEAHLYPIQVEDKLGRKTTRKIMLVSESGLYKLVMRSDKKGLSESNSLSSLFGGGTSFPWSAQGEYGDAWLKVAAEVVRKTSPRIRSKEP